jgi:hypothetical protein
LLPAPANVPACEALNPLRKVCSTIPSSLAAGPAPTACTRFTAWPLNSACTPASVSSSFALVSVVDTAHRSLEDEI